LNPELLGKNARDPGFLGKKFRVQIIIFCLAGKKASRDMSERVLAGFQESRVIVNHFVAGFQAGRVKPYYTVLAVCVCVCLSCLSVWAQLLLNC